MPKKYRVKITATAERDIESIFDYIACDDPDAAIRWIREIERQIGSIESFPKRCPLIPEFRELGQEYRHLLYGDYRTIFRIKGASVIIMRVVHGAQLLDLQILEK